MHEIYHTEGFIVRMTDLGEANTLFRIFTRDFGLITATAQSLRREKSKLRGHLSLYAFIALDVVRGRDLWRITAVRTIDDLPFSMPLRSKRIYGRTLEAVDRLYHGEEPHKLVFSHMQELTQLLKEKTFSEQELKFLDTLSVTRLLAHLGYLKETEVVAQFTQSLFTVALAGMDESINRTLISQSQEALKASHL